jgi:hypothetical protein
MRREVRYRAGGGALKGKRAPDDLGDVQVGAAENVRFEVLPIADQSLKERNFF